MTKSAVYGYSETDYGYKYYKGSSYNDRINIRFIMLAKSKAEFLRKVKPLSNSTTNWIRARISETGNDAEIELANKHVGKVVIYQNWHPENILKIC